MNSLLYYDPYHHHDPAIIGVHTLLKPQVYQQPTYINTPPSQPNQCISPLSIPYVNKSLFPSNFTHLNTHSATTQYRSSQFHQPATYHLSNTNYPTPWGVNNHTPHQEPIHTITATTPPSFCGFQNLSHHQQPINNDSQHSQYSIHHPTLPSFNNTPTPFNITQSHTYVTPKQICEQPANTFNNTVEQLKVVAETDNHKEATESLPISKPVLVATAIITESVNSVSETDETSASHEEATHAHKEEPHGIIIDESDFSNISDSISEIMDEQKEFVVETFNFDLVPDSIQERKQHVTEACKHPNQSRLELNSSNVVFSGVNINIISAAISAAMDQQVITTDFFINNTVRSSKLFDLHPHILDLGGDERLLAMIFGNGVCVFDPGSDERIFCSSALISINNHGTQSPLRVPWDRGKFEVCSFLSSASELSGISSNPPLSFLWEPWDRGKKSCGEAVCSAELFGKKEVILLYRENTLSEWALLFGNLLGFKIITWRK